MGVSLRAATAADVPTLEIIRRQAIEASFSPHYPRNAYADLVAAPDPDLPEYVDSDAYATVVVETPVTPAAYATVRRSDGELLAVYTSPDYEGRGYGRRALEWLADILEQEGIETMTVRSPEPAEGFFATCGFDPMEKRTDAAIPRVDMERELSTKT